MLTGRRKINPLNNCAGFTMIELILVSVIIAALLAVSLPTFSKIYADTQLKSGAQVLSATLRYAYQSAVSQQIKYKMDFDPIAGKYWVENEQDSGEFRQVKSGLIKPIFLADAVSFKKISAPHIIFYPNGSADNVAIQLQNKNDKIYTIHFSGLTGQVEVFDYARE